MIPNPAPEGTPPPSGLLHLRTWLDPELDETFSVWCDGHHGEQLEVPGFRRVRRFSLVAASPDAGEPADYLTVYDLDRLDVLESDAYAAYRARGNAVPDELQGRLRAARTDAWLVAAVPAAEGAGPDGAGMAHLFVPEAADLTTWFADHGTAIVDALAAAGATVARLFRGSNGEQVVIVVLDRAPDDGGALGDLPVPGDAGPGTGWALYRLDHVDTPDGPAASPHRARHRRP